MPSTSFKKSWVLSISGATNALERVDLALDSKEADAKVIQPLIEALWWVCAADESLTKEYPAQWPDNLRPSLPELPVLKGLRWVRNRATHQISQWEIAKPPFQWEDASIIAPPGSVKRGRDHGRAEYTAYLQGHDARDAIKTLSEAITREAIGKLPP
jgi:hypothetical protein